MLSPWANCPSTNCIRSLKNVPHGPLKTNLNSMFCWPCTSKYAIIKPTWCTVYLSSLYWVSILLHVSGLLVEGNGKPLLNSKSCLGNPLYVYRITRCLSRLEGLLRRLLVAHHQEVVIYIYVSNGTCYTTVGGPADSRLRRTTHTNCHIHCYLRMLGK
jgi:hypothetical protein